MLARAGLSTRDRSQRDCAIWTALGCANGLFFWTKGAFQPEELSALKKVFDEVTAEPWFDAAEEAREKVAKYLFEMFPGVTFDPQKHRPIVEATARTFFARDGNQDRSAHR